MVEHHLLLVLLKTQLLLIYLLTVLIKVTQCMIWDNLQQITNNLTGHNLDSQNLKYSGINWSKESLQLLTCCWMRITANGLLILILILIFCLAKVVFLKNYGEETEFLNIMKVLRISLSI